VFKRLLYIFLFLFAGVAAFAQQYPVQGSLAIASPYPANLSDYANSSIQNVALNLTLTDLAMNNKRVRLKLFIQTQNATIAQSIDNISGEPLIMLDGGIPQRFTNNELAHYFRLENLQGINPDAYARSLPEGIYTIGFEVYDYFTGNKLSGRIAQTFWIIINDPPLLNSPTDKSKIADFTSGSGSAGGIIFNWTPRSTQVTNTEYEFTLCELWDATGDPYQQFMSAIPKYQTTVSNTTTLIYSLAQPTLISGYTYAWRVRAKAKAGFEDIGLYRNDGYSNLFTFRYGDPCPAPQSLVLETKTSDQISATWQAPLTTGSGSGEAYKIAYRKYTIAGQWNWAESETSNLFLTISNLEPSTEYEIKVGVPCNDGNSAAPLFPGTGAGGEMVFTPSQRATTLPAKQIAGIECGKEPVIDLSKQTLLTLLKAGDVVMANDFPTTISSVTGTSQGWSGEGWTKVPWLGDARIHVKYNNIKVNTDYKLIDGSFDTVYNPSGKNIGDVDQTVANATAILNDYGDLFVASGEQIENTFGSQTEPTTPTISDSTVIESNTNSTAIADNTSTNVTNTTDSPVSQTTTTSSTTGNVNNTSNTTNNNTNIPTSNNTQTDVSKSDSIKTFALTQLTATDFSAKSRVAHAGETLYYINKPITTEHKKTSFSIAYSPDIPIKEIAKDKINWKMDGVAYPEATGTKGFVTNIDDAKNHTVSVGGGYPILMDKSVSVKWVDEDYKKTKLTIGTSSIPYLKRTMELSDLMGNISNKLEKIPFFAKTKKNERIDGKIGFYFDITPFQQELINEADKKSRLYYQKRTIKGGLDIGLSGSVKYTIWGLPIDKIPVVGEKLKEYISAGIYVVATAKAGGELKGELIHYNYVNTNYWKEISSRVNPAILKLEAEFGVGAEVKFLKQNDYLNFTGDANGKANAEIFSIGWRNNDFQVGFIQNGVYIDFQATFSGTFLGKTLETTPYYQRVTLIQPQK